MSRLALSRRHGLRLLAARWDGQRPEVDLEIACSSGTYVRSLARDLAVGWRPAEHGIVGRVQSDGQRESGSR